MAESKAETQLLTKEQMLKAPSGDYMNAQQLAYFKKLLFDLHESTLARILEAKQQMAKPLECNDDGDRAALEEQSMILLRIVEREQKLLPKIEKALVRIRTGQYGYCLDTGEPIGIPRLLARPTAEYCAEVKTLKEIKENLYR